MDPEIFPVFWIFEPPQHRPHVELRRPGSALRNPGFPFFTGGRAAGSGGRAAVSAIWGCWLRISASEIYIHLLPINRPCGRYVIMQKNRTEEQEIIRNQENEDQKIKNYNDQNVENVINFSSDRPREPEAVQQWPHQRPRPRLQPWLRSWPWPTKSH